MDLSESTRAAAAMVGGLPAEVLDAPEGGRLIVTPHPVLLDGQRNMAADLRPGESLEAFLLRHVDGIDSGAWSVAIGGYDVPRAMWSRTFPKHGQLIACRASVHKSFVRIIALAALTYFTMGAGAAWIGGTFGVGAFGAAVIGTALFVAGSVLINKVLGPKVSGAASVPGSKDVYSLSSQRNTARPYEPIGVLLGEMRVSPDLASNPYAWYESDDQYLSTILLGGINVASYSDLSIGDTPLSSFSDVKVYTNGFSGMASEQVPLFSNADSIPGGQLEDTTAWVLRTSSTGTVMLQVDLEYQLFGQGKKGIEYATARVEMQYRAVGASVWLPLGASGSVTLSNNTTETRRLTVSQVVDEGQYEVQVRRTDGPNGDNTTRSIQWTVLKSIQPDETDYSGWGRIGIRIKATGQLSGALDTLRATFKPRPLPVWNGAAWVNQTAGGAAGVSNPGALILQVLRGIYDPNGVLQFGFGFSDEQIDVEGFKGFILHCTANGYRYDRWHTAQISLRELCDEIALAGLGQFMWLDGSRPTVRWAADGQPLAGVVNMANMKRGGFVVDYTLTNAADGIEYQYADRDRGYEVTTLRVAAPGVTTMLNPARIEGRGITTEAQAAVLARYHLGQSLYQFKEIGFGADIEHLDYQRMAILSLSHDMTQWGFGGRLAGARVVGGKVVLTLDEPVPALTSRFVGLRVPGKRDYRVFNVQAFVGTATEITLVEPWPEDLVFPGNTDDNPPHDTLWCYDVKATPGYRVRVVSIEPEADLKGASVRVVPEGPEFWNYVLTGTYQPAPSQSLIPQLQRPGIENLRVTAQTNTQGNTEWVELNAVWDSTGDLDHCQVWAAIDGQELRLRDAQALGNRATFRIDANGSWLVQVRPFDSRGRAGEPASRVYVTNALDAPPWNVDTFLLDEIDGGLRRFRFGYTGDRPPALAGVQIRYRAGTAPISESDWDSLTPIGSAGDVYTAALETTRPPAGTWSFACRAITTAGVLAAGVKTLTRTLDEVFPDITAPDLTPPPMPTGVTLTVGFATITIRHPDPTYTEGHGHALTRVYGVQVAAGAPEPVFSGASQVFEFTGPIGSFSTKLGASWRLWVVWVSNDGKESPPAGGTNGFTATTGKIGNADLAPLAVQAEQLAADAVNLGSDKVTGTITNPARFGALAVGYTVTQYLLATSGVMQNLVVDSAQIASLAADKILAGSLAVGRYIQSTNYVAGTSGWRIEANGNAEFAAASIRGQLSASQMNGNGLTIRHAVTGKVIIDAGANVPIPSDMVNPAANWVNPNLFTGSLAAPSGFYLGSGVVATDRPDPYGLPTAVVLSIPTAGAYVAYTVNGGQPGFYRVRLKLYVDNASSVVVATTDSATWDTSERTTAQGSAGGSWVEVVLRQYTANGKVDVIVGASYRSPQLNSTPASFWVTVCGLTVERESFTGDLNADSNTKIGINSSGQIYGVGAGSGTPISNNQMSIDANGVLRNAGAAQGQVTIGGLGFTGDLNAAAGTVFVPRGSGVVKGSTITRPAGAAGWNSGAYSKSGYSGGAMASWVAGGGNAMGGLNNDPLSVTDWPALDAVWYFEQGAGNAYILESGVFVHGPRAAAIGDVFTVTHDGAKLRYYHNGTLVRTLAWEHNNPLYFDSLGDNLDSTLKSCQFGPLSSSAWSQISGAGRPQDNATVGATIGLNLGGSFTQPVWDTVMTSALIKASHIQSLSVDVLSTTMNGGSAIGMQMSTNRLDIYDEIGARRVRIGRR